MSMQASTNSTELYSTEINEHEAADNKDKPKVLLIVPDDKYMKSENSSSFEEIIADDSDFKNKTLPQFDVLEWKENAVQSGSFEIKHYIDLAKQIHHKYLDYDGFVILDSITTIPYTASYLSFMFENLAKPVVLTGSHSDSLHQIFSDAKPNLLHSLTLAGYTNICEVIVCFNKKIYRGNRLKRKDINHDPFITYNCPQLGQFVVTNLELTKHCMRHTVKRRFKTYTKLFTNIIVIQLIPQLTDDILKLLLFSQLTKKRKPKTTRTPSMNSPIAQEQYASFSTPVLHATDTENSKISLSFYSLPSSPSTAAATAHSTKKPAPSIPEIKLEKASKSSPLHLKFPQSRTSDAAFSEELKEFQVNLQNLQNITSGSDSSDSNNGNNNNKNAKADAQKPTLRKIVSFDSLHAQHNGSPHRQQIARLNSVQSIRVRASNKMKKAKSATSKPTVKGVVFSFFGVGNAPARQSFKDVLKTAITEYECEIAVTCQSMMGGVDSSIYASGDFLSDLNLMSAGDMTIECCVAKLAYLMGKGYRGKELKEQFETNLRGELTEMQEKKRRVVQHIPMQHFEEEEDGSSAEFDEDAILEDSDENANHND
mmetsp:Transcript_65828/g.104849  ORF Transcript_65828/g.104849 Transcript_65828/m.104849 type:complete len:596 (-) Transcript_65828:32-1819(-)